MSWMLMIVALLPFVVGHNHQEYDTVKRQCWKPVNGRWGEWSSFGPCSKTCGTGGTQKRHRYCDSPIPKYGGRDCVGDEIEVKPCERYTACPVNGGYGDWHKGKCSKKCGGGVVIYRRQCNNPRPQHCGKPCEGPHTRKEHCNTHRCKNHGACKHCFLKAEKYAQENGVPGFVGHACRVDQSYCDSQKNGIRDMYPANHWFFLHCSADGPWCKPCATRNLVYNPTCGQCEATANGRCTGPQNWQDEIDGELDFIEKSENDDNW